MSKARRSKRSSRSVRSRVARDPSEATDVMSQLECAGRHPSAALLGAVIGGLVPLFARTLAHDELPAMWSASRGLAMVMLVVVLGCAVFSALTVYKFGKAAFGDSRKALGFVLALEGVMLLSRGMTSVLALLVLIGINAVANGSVIALARDATCRRREADARRSATRARNRSAGRVAPEPAQVQPAAEPPFEVVTVVDMPMPAPASRRRTARRSPVFTQAQLAAPADDVIDADYRMLLS